MAEKTRKSFGGFSCVFVIIFWGAPIYLIREITPCLQMIYIAADWIFDELCQINKKTERSDTSNIQSSIFNSGLSGPGLTNRN
jgi:hypothetical protein